jgi:hypothetical protein
MAEVAMVAPQRGRRDRSRRYKKHGPERPRARRTTSSGHGRPTTDPVAITDGLATTPARPRGDREGTDGLAAQLSEAREMGTARAGDEAARVREREATVARTISAGSPPAIDQATPT